MNDMARLDVHLIPGSLDRNLANIRANSVSSSGPLTTESMVNYSDARSIL